MARSWDREKLLPDGLTRAAYEPLLFFGPQLAVQAISAIIDQPRRSKISVVRISDE